jgi:hypothetical protein
MALRLDLTDEEANAMDTILTHSWLRLTEVERLTLCSTYPKLAAAKRAMTKWMQAHGDTAARAANASDR